MTRPALRIARTGALLMLLVASPAAAQAPAPTTLVILGVDHSAQLVARGYHPGWLRAFIERVKPTALCVERSPDEFARGDMYEFTYELQHVAVPWARAHATELCPVDWLPTRDDERLAFGRLEVVELPAVRGPTGFQGFLTIEGASLGRSLFYADSEPNRAEARAFYDHARVSGGREFPRRLGLYRTYMQAMRVRAAARAHPGGTVLLVIGSMHKDDIETTLAGDPTIRIMQPATFGAPTLADADAHLEPRDLAAILSFNLLGVQPLVATVDWKWVGEVLDRLTKSNPSLVELPLLRTRYEVLVNHRGAADAAAAYERIASATDSTARFLWTGVEDGRRLDSYFDPFGNLRVRQRAMVEAAREWVRAGDVAKAERIRAMLLAAETGAMRRGQLLEYWSRYVSR